MRKQAVIKKTMFGKKIHSEHNDYEGVLRFRSRQNFIDFYSRIEDTCIELNFAGEPYNMNCFCRDEKYTYSPNLDSLCILVTVTYIY